VCHLQSSNYTDLFSADGPVVEEDSLDDLLSDDVDGYGGQRDSRRRSTSGDRKNFAYFGPREARVLSNLLTHTHLPGLSTTDQLHLLALADTVASCNLNFAERFAIDAATAQLAKEGSPGTGDGASAGALHRAYYRLLDSLLSRKLLAL
jgi:hypothetical protein